MEATDNRDTPPFRAEHIGSLLRPRELTHAFRALREGALSAPAYRELLDRCIRDVVALQEEVGLRSITDGEFRRASYWAHFVEAVDGLTMKPAAFSFHDADGRRLAFSAPYVDGPVRRGRGISGAELDFLKSVTTRTPKVTMPSPSTMHFWGGPEAFAAGTYDHPDAFFSDLGAVYREEIADLARRGARYLQLDEVPLAMLCDENVRRAVRGFGADPAALTTCYIEAINSAVAERPAGMTIGLHLCRGNYKARWLSEGGYDAVAERLFNDVAVDAFFLEYDSERAGDFRPLRHVPQGKSVVLGLVTTKSALLEDPDDLARRVDAASRHLPLERLAISPQCGFSSAVTGNPLSVDDERRKLRLVVEVAERVWG